MTCISLLITGQIKSRGRIEIINKQLAQAYKIIKTLNYKNEIVISTYKEELEGLDQTNYDKVILNEDPGPDNFRVSPYPISRKSGKSTNYSRMFATTISGLKQCQNNIVIKTRIELIPEEFSKFKNWIESICMQINKSAVNRIAFLTEHYNGIVFSIDGTLGTIPNTIQVAEKKVLQELWDSSQKFWQSNFEILTRKNHIFPITDEQIVGLNYLGLFCGFPIFKEVRKLRRYYFTKNLVSAILMAETQLYIWTRYRDSGLTVNKFKGTLSIITPESMQLDSITAIAKKLYIIKLKKYYHISRRCLNAFS